MNWKKLLADVLKYALAAICGALGITVTGCALVPVF